MHYLSRLPRHTFNARSNLTTPAPINKPRMLLFKTTYTPEAHTKDSGSIDCAWKVRKLPGLNIDPVSV